MEFEETLLTLRKLLGTEIAISLTDPVLGPGTGYVADFDGLLRDIREPIPDVDQDVYYCKVGETAGFALPRAEFREARWQEIGGQRSLVILLPRIELSIFPVRADETWPG